MSGATSLASLSALDARVLRATDPFLERTAARVAGIVGCSEDVASSCLRRLRGWMLVEVDGCRPTGWLRPIAAMSRWSTSREPSRGRVGELVSESITG